MLFFALLTGAFAQGGCGMPDNVDPDSKCNIDLNGYANLDHSSFTGGFAIDVTTKAATIDADGSSTHGATNGAITWNDDDKRFELDCPQTADEKTVKITVTRPSEYTSFGAEWIQMFPKDSWENVTNEYEPFTFNDYGSKIPLREFRPQADHCASGTLADGWTTCEEGFTEQDNVENTINVFMEVNDEGDFEFKYGTPSLVSDGVVGSADAKWVAHEFKQRLFRVGNPWANCAAGAAGTSDYGSVGVILPALYGNPNLEYDTYNNLIADLAGTTVPTKVVIQAYGVDLDLWTEGDVNAVSVAPNANGETLLSEGETYNKCYRAGNPCPLNHEVCSADYCNLQRWREIVTNLQAIANVEVLAHVETYTGTNSAQVTVPQRTAGDMTADIDSYKTNIPTVNGYYFNQVNGGDAAVEVVLGVSTSEGEGFVVFASGEPLMNKDHRTANGSPDVWITLANDVNNMGIWTPFSWFSGVAASQWGAIVHSVPAGDITTTATALFDRGYGWVYLHSAADFTYESDHTIDAIDAVATRAAGRRLSESPRRLEAAAPHWGCDDTLFECRPVCMQTLGVTTIKVADSECTAAPMDECSCSCYYNAKWSTCHGDEVKCVATMTGVEKVVGDLVCTTRGSPKPEHATLQRMMAECQEKETTRGSFPSDTCIANFGATEAPTTVAPTDAPTDAPVVEDASESEDIEIESFAAPAFLAAAIFAQI